ncbi:MAG: EAL domain-containing protein, partial [Acidobacteriota bacterium]|nr:EAL domain-containing protein [Acidobacteriota bacterium]
TDFVTKPVNYVLMSHRVRYMLRASRAMADVLASEERLSNAQRIAHLGQWDWDVNSGGVLWTGDTETFFGSVFHCGSRIWSIHELLDRVHESDKRRLLRALLDALHRRKPASLEHRIYRADGGERIVHHQAEARFDGTGRPVGLTGTLQDVTEREQSQAKIRFLAFHDSLTGLPNREAFRKELQKALTHVQRHDRLAAALLIDLDNFKRINDTLSHRSGDMLLKIVADRLTGVLRGSDSIMRSHPDSDQRNVARLGGDEFTILLSEVSRVEDAASVARRVLETISEPLQLGGQDLIITPSIGIAVFPHDGEDADTLLMSADTAMYHAKEAGGNSFQFYARSMNARMLEQLGLETRLRRAINDEEFIVHYQPQVDLRTGRIVGVEALLRWQNPELGMISPGQFIPLAEQTGLIGPLGEWALREACEQCQSWLADGFPPLRIAVNLSAIQFRQSSLAATVRDVLDESGLDPERLELELTESALMQNADTAMSTLEELSSMGVRLAVDDFGTGYSSLSYLKRFPVNALKIDRSFVGDVPADPGDVALISAIIALAKSLELNVVAEGVENHEQLEFLQSLDCDEAQGYLLARPVPADKLAQLLRETGGVLAVCRAAELVTT